MSRFLTLLGLAVSLLYTICLALLLRGRAGQLDTLPLNELGDFLAGVFGPLALLWLILGYLQQGIELRLSTRALEVQVAELRNSVEQQRHLVDVARRQLEAEGQVLDYERHRHHVASKPRFVVDRILRTPADAGMPTFSIDVRNVGNTVSQVSARLVPDARSLAPSDVEVWDTGQSVSFVVTMPDWRERDRHLSLRYVNVEGVPGVRFFAVSSVLTGPVQNITVVPLDMG